MNKKFYNSSLFNLRNIFLVIGSIFLLIISTFILFMERYGFSSINEYTNIYIVISSIFITILILSIGYLVAPIAMHVRRKKVSTLNSKFTLYFILIALTPAVCLGIIGTLLLLTLLKA